MTLFRVRMYLSAIWWEHIANGRRLPVISNMLSQSFVALHSQKRVDYSDFESLILLPASSSAERGGLLAMIVRPRV
jgi:hypothetical protein